MNRVLTFVLVLILILTGLALCCSAGARAAVSGIVTGGGPFRLKVSDPDYTHLLKGEKTVEARIDDAPFNRLKPGDPIVVIRARPMGDTSEYPGGRYKYQTTVSDVKKYKDLKSLLKAEGVEKVYPGRKEQVAVEQFEKFLKEGKSQSDAVIALHLAKPPKQGAGEYEAYEYDYEF